MRLKLPATFVAALGVVLLTGSAASAQSIPSPFRFIEKKQEAGPSIGFVDASTGRFGYGPKGGTVYGGRWGIELAGPLSFEGVTTIIDGSRDIVNPARVEGDRVVGEGDVLLTTFEARFKFSLVGQRAWHGLSPFLVAGGGAVLDFAGEPEADSDLLPEDRFDFGTSFLGTAGLGTRWFVSERLTLRADAVFSLWRLPTPPGFSDPARGFEGVEEGEWVQALSITLSTLIRW